MLGHWLSLVACLLGGHVDPIREFGPYGLQWRCQRCMRVEQSAALRKVVR